MAAALSSSGCVISSVNLAEVAAKGVDAGALAEDAASAVDGLVEVEAFGLLDAITSARLRSATRQAGLSFGDRACLALAERLGMPALTADQSWATLTLAAEVVLIRGPAAAGSD